MKNKAITGIIALAAVAAVIGGAAVFHANYVILGKDWIAYKGDPAYDDIYRRDEKTLWLHERLNSFTIPELNRCTAVESLMLHCTDNETLAKLSVFAHLDALTFSIADETLTANGMAFISRQPALETINFFQTNADLTGIQSDTLREAVIYGANIANISELANCPALEKLSCPHIVIDDHLRSADETNPAVNQYFTDADGEGFVIRPLEAVNIKFYMDDSSDFEVRTLSFADVTFNDISGLLDMDSLEKLRLHDCEMSGADRRALEEKGVAVEDVVSEDSSYE